LRPQKLVDIGFDTRVVWQREYRQGEELEKVVRGGGGTSFVDLFKVCAEMNPLPKCVVVLTDLDGTMPKEEPPFPVLWVVYGGGNKAPFGEVIQVD
jgi:predicted metal-dependent peptidase